MNNTPLEITRQLAVAFVHTKLDVYQRIIEAYRNRGSNQVPHEQGLQVLKLGRMVKAHYFDGLLTADNRHEYSALMVKLLCSKFNNAATPYDDTQWTHTTSRVTLSGSEINLHNLPKEKPTMKIETQILVNGVEFSKYTNDQLFAIIVTAEAEIKSLSNIENKPKALKARMLELQTNIDELIKLMDAKK